MSAATIAPAPPVGRANALSNTLTIARRNLLHIKSDPEQLVGMTIQPLMFLVLFVFVFGGAIAGSSQQYLQFALPGIIVQGIAFTPFTTALGLNVDFQRGLIDRFRSLPIARSSVIAGRIVADTVRIIWGEIILISFGVLLGFRYGGGFAGAIGAFLLVMAFGITLCWPMAFIGITAKTPEAVNTWGFLIILPLTFASSVFVSPASMPGWLQPIVNLNPITKVVNATRALMLGVGPVAKPVLQSIIWMIVIVGVFAPLAVAKYRRRM
ncbi:MAG TPA: ABC transporter permease [Actinomycetota bacterium]|jgi:ABC-2 type transport system permease protein/oleandomycin transport system permease protein